MATDRETRAVRREIHTEGGRRVWVADEADELAGAIDPRQLPLGTRAVAIDERAGRRAATEVSAVV